MPKRSYEGKVFCTTAAIYIYIYIDARVPSPKSAMVSLARSFTRKQLCCAGRLCCLASSQHLRNLRKSSPWGFYSLPSASTTTPQGRRLCLGGADLDGIPAEYVEAREGEAETRSGGYPPNSITGGSSHESCLLIVFEPFPVLFGKTALLEAVSSGVLMVLNSLRRTPRRPSVWVTFSAQDRCPVLGGRQDVQIDMLALTDVLMMLSCGMVDSIQRLSASWLSTPGPPVVPTFTNFCGWEGSPTKIDYRKKKRYPYSSTSKTGGPSTTSCGKIFCPLRAFFEGAS